MFHRKSLSAGSCLAIILLCLSSNFYSVAFSAQTDETIDKLKTKALVLTRENNFAEALPLLEKIVAAEPDNGEMQFYLGSALIAQANNNKDSAQRKSLSLRARAAFVRAKELGMELPLIDAMITSIPIDGSERRSFSQNVAADALMSEAEIFFAQGKLDDALRNYQKALALDPRLYQAALFAGDVFVQKEDFAQAQSWYERAIAIDPAKETAYRYSATPLMKQGKTEAARDRYIEAFITEPYNQFARAGLIQWAQITQTDIAHPSIDIPTNVTFDDKGNANINLDTSALLGGKEDGSFAWIAYGATRTSWRKEQFTKKFPKERVYRHSLPEEAEALRSVITLAMSEKKVKTLNSSLVKLKRLNDEGLLEAYILLGRPDDGIAQDHPAYLKENRDKLRRYMIQYVATGGGNWQKF
jgi:tetratricopeptide (TPR) repeat protein